MILKGIFGYIIGRKKRFMRVDDDADLLWRILVREIYVIMKHFECKKERVLEAFEKIKVAKGEPKQQDMKKYELFTDTNHFDNNNEWSKLLRFCQSSFINLLEAKTILLHENKDDKDDKDNKDNKDNKDDYDYKFEFDFNNWEARFFNKKDVIERATLEEIMSFEEMPTRTYTEIVGEMTNHFHIYYDKSRQIEEELDKLYKLKADAMSQCAVNIEEKVDKLIDDMKWELKDLNMNRRVFYHRLKALDLL